MSTVGHVDGGRAHLRQRKTAGGRGRYRCPLDNPLGNKGETMPRSLSDELPGMVVGDMMNRWPQAVPVLVRHGMACPGCLMAPFMTVHEAAREHGVSPRRLVRELADAITNPLTAPPSPSAHEGAEA